MRRSYAASVNPCRSCSPGGAAEHSVRHLFFGSSRRTQVLREHLILREPQRNPALLLIHYRLASSESEKEISDENNHVLPGASCFGSVHVSRVRPGTNPHFRGSEV